jgi:uncharacterized membrane protein YgdD (TMEM256/DUF423 family)
MPFWTIGTLFGASSVMIGAFGAHGLKARISDPARLANWSTAAQYQVRLFSLFFLFQIPSKYCHKFLFVIQISRGTRPMHEVVMVE